MPLVSDWCVTGQRQQFASHAYSGSLFVAFLVKGGGDAGRCQVLAQLLDFLLGENVAVVGMVQGAFYAVQQHAKPCPLDGLHAGAQMMQQGFDFTPVNVAADRVLEDRADQVYVLVAHALTHAAWVGWPILNNRGRTTI